MIYVNWTVSVTEYTYKRFTLTLYGTTRPHYETRTDWRAASERRNNDTL